MFCIVVTEAVAPPARPASIEELVKEDTPLLEHPLFKDFDKFRMVYSFAELLKLGFYLRGYGIPVGWVADNAYDGNSRVLSPEAIVKVVGNGIVINTFSYVFSQSLRNINCGVISSSGDRRYLRWKPFIG